MDTNWTREWNYTFGHFFSTAYLKHDEKWTMNLVTAYTFIFGLGLLGNLSVIVVLRKYSFMRTVTNLFILNLAIADLLVVILCLPCTLLVSIFVPWMLDNLLCKIMPFIQGASVFASVYSMVAISLDRCIAFRRPTGKSFNGFTTSQAKLTIALIWFFALLVHIPLLFVFEVVYSLEESDYGIAYCWELWGNSDHGNIFFIIVPLVICFALPLCAVCILNLVILRNLQRFKRLAKELQLPLRYDTRGVTKMLWIIALTFVVCWSPLLVLLTKIKFYGPVKFGSGATGINVQEVLMALAQLMGSCNSCINPILYAYHNMRFRICLASLFRRQRQISLKTLS